MKLVILSRRGRGDAVVELARRAGYEAEVTPELTGLSGDILVGFSTGVIVPPDVLRKFEKAYNFHGAPPEYPGRDPHYWAVRDGAKSFGCTCHLMTERVDEGAIVDVLRFPCNGMGAEELRLSAQVLMIAQFINLLPRIGELKAIGVQWSGVKRSRRDFVDAGLEFENDDNIVEELMWREMESNYAVELLTRLNDSARDPRVTEYLSSRASLD